MVVQPANIPVSFSVGCVAFLQYINLLGDSAIQQLSQKWIEMKGPMASAAGAEKLADSREGIAVTIESDSAILGNSEGDALPSSSLFLPMRTLLMRLD